MQCKAITAKGSQCKRQAVKGGFCNQHSKKKTLSKEKKPATKKKTISKGKKPATKKAKPIYIYDTERKYFPKLPNDYIKKEIEIPFETLVKESLVNDKLKITKAEMANRYFFPAGEYRIGDPAGILDEQQNEIYSDGGDHSAPKLEGDYNWDFIQNDADVEGVNIISFHYLDYGPFIYNSKKKLLGRKGQPAIDSGEVIMAPEAVAGVEDPGLSAIQLKFPRDFAIVPRKLIRTEIERLYFVDRKGNVMIFMDI